MKQKAKNKSEISWMKKFSFRVIAFLIPFIILFFVEAGLRIANYGTKLSLFKTDQTQKYYYLNPEIGKRYFTQEINATNGNIDFFRVRKAPGTLRVFVLGSSTALGFPYMYNGAFPRMLNYRLQRQFPKLKIEIVNLSFSAISTYAVLDMAKELTAYEPDAVLIYAGQNEYHGSLGVASSSSLGSNPFLVNLFMLSKHSRLMQWVYNTIYNSRKNSASTDLNLTLMERLAAGYKIPFNSKKYKQGIKIYRRNMNKMIDLFTNENVPVFVGTLVTNERGIHPFVSNLSNPENEENFQTLFYEGKNALEKGDTTKAIHSFLSANIIDSMYAECHFQLGEIAFAQKDFTSAKEYYTNAKDLDNLRFRAPKFLNEIIIQNTTKRNNVYLADIAKVFENNSPHRIIGNELLLEHVHPNLRGYFLMADTYFKEMLAANIFPESTTELISSEHIQQQMPLTQFDTIYGYVSNILLQESWPFNEALPEPTAAEQTYEGKVAGALAVKQFSWEEAMEKLFNYYFKNGELENALKIAEGQCLEFPFDGVYFERAAKLAQNLNNNELAIFYLSKIWKNFTQKVEIAQQLLISTLRADRPDLALSYLNYIMANSSENQNLVDLKSAAEQIIRLKETLIMAQNKPEVLNKIATLYIKFDNTIAAKKYINQSLQIDATNTETLKLKRKVEQLN